MLADSDVAVDVFLGYNDEENDNAPRKLGPQSQCLQGTNIQEKYPIYEMFSLF